MKTKIRAIITKLRGIEDDLIDLLGDSTEKNTDYIDQMLDKAGLGSSQPLKDSFHELSEALAKANKMDIMDVGRHIHYDQPTPIKFSRAGRIDEIEISILDEEKIDTGFNLDFDELKAIPHVPSVENLAVAIGTKDHPDWFKRQKAELDARITPHNWLAEPILTEKIKPLSTEELDAQTTKVIHLKEIANKNATIRLGEYSPTATLQKMKTKRINSKDVGGPVKPPKKVARTEQRLPGEQD